jgi:hypothetical protein
MRPAVGRERCQRHSGSELTVRVLVLKRSQNLLCKCMNGIGLVTILRELSLLACDCRIVRLPLHKGKRVSSHDIHPVDGTKIIEQLLASR